MEVSARTFAPITSILNDMIMRLVAVVVIENKHSIFKYEIVMSKTPYQPNIKD